MKTDSENLVTIAALLGFNGEWQDSVPGGYHLGKGYRMYNPALRRFTSPDSLSPFGAGGINSYSYCAGDPINHTDPSGHALSSNVLAFYAGLLTAITMQEAPGGSIEEEEVEENLATRNARCSSSHSNDTAPEEQSGGRGRSYSGERGDEPPAQRRRLYSNASTVSNTSGLTADYERGNIRSYNQWQHETNSFPSGTLTRDGEGVPNWISRYGEDVELRRWGDDNGGIYGGEMFFERADEVPTDFSIAHIHNHYTPGNLMSVVAVRTNTLTAQRWLSEAPTWWNRHFNTNYPVPRELVDRLRTPSPIFNEPPPPYCR
jgi:RHS repeat-associated protein